MINCESCNEILHEDNLRRVLYAKIDECVMIAYSVKLSFKK